MELRKSKMKRAAKLSENSWNWLLMELIIDTNTDTNTDYWY